MVKRMFQNCVSAVLRVFSAVLCVAITVFCYAELHGENAETHGGNNYKLVIFHSLTGVAIFGLSFEN